MTENKNVLRQHENETFQSIKELLDAMPDRSSQHRLIAMLAASVDYNIPTTQKSYFRRRFPKQNLNHKE